VILGIGVDITPIERIERILRTSHAERFLKRVFSRTEIEAAFKSPKPSEKLAGMFAAKEAVSKALGTGFSSGVYPNRILIEKTPKGAPKVSFSDQLINILKDLDAGVVFLSLTHSDSLASAFVVIEKNNNQVF
jgi:holo-[acyl-carrier protein] synthase